MNSVGLIGITISIHGEKERKKERKKEMRRGSVMAEEGLA